MKDLALKTILCLLILGHTGVAFSAVFDREIRLRTESFLSPDYRATSDRTFSFVGARFSNLDHTDSWKEPNVLLVDLDGSVSPQSPALSYLNIEQVYLGSDGFQFGRKKQSWSSLDEIWGTGLVQPNLRWNPFTPQQQGLTGFFLEMGNNREKDVLFPFKTTLFASFIYIPDQNPGFEIKDGRFESTTPWFPQMPTTVLFDNTDPKLIPILWKVTKPEVNKVIFHPSYLAALQLGREEVGFSMQGTLSYKPANQLALGGDFFLASNNSVQASAYAEVYMHQLATLDFKYALEQIQFGLTGAYENPQKPDFSSQLTYVAYKDSFLLSPFVMGNFDRWSFLLSYLNVEGGEAVGYGPKFSDFSGVLPQRYGFRQAYKVKIESDLYRQKNQNIVGYIDTLVGANDDYSLLNMGVRYQVSRQWNVQTNTLLIRSRLKDVSQAALFQQYASNDLLNLGVQYVF